MLGNMPPLTLGEARQAAQQRMQQLPHPPRPFMIEDFIREEEGDENDVISSSLLGTVSVPTALRNRLDLRSGKWTKEEEQFAFTIIQQFQNGTLQVPETSTVSYIDASYFYKIFKVPCCLVQLRQCLSVALNCDAMRISKKFAGPYSIGKQVFTPLDKSHANYSVLTAVAADELNIGRTNWFRKLDEIENQALSRTRKKMRLDTKGAATAIFNDPHLVLRDKAESADLESFQSAIMSLSSLKRTEQAQGLGHAGRQSDSLRAINDEKIPGVVGAIEKILRGEFAQHVPVIPVAPMWAAQAQAFPHYVPQQLQQLQQQQLMQMQLMQMQHQSESVNPILPNPSSLAVGKGLQTD